MSQDSKADYPDKGAGVDPSEGARNVDPSEGNVDPSERGGVRGEVGGQGGGSSRPQEKGGINPVQHSE